MSKRHGRSKRSGKARTKSAPRRRLDVAQVDVEQLDAVREQLQRLAMNSGPPRWNADPEDVRRSVAKLVLTLVEFIRQLLERQSIRRMESGTLTAEQIESLGLALMRLEDAVREIGAQFGLAPEELNLDLGPVGKLI
jgi:hypothetical protein